MDYKLEVLVLPVSDVDRARAFYEKLGFRLDIDYVANEAYRVAQFTPSGSGCSIIIGKGISDAVPGSVQGLHLVVNDIVKARDEGRRNEGRRGASGDIILRARLLPGCHEREGRGDHRDHKSVSEWVSG